MATAERNSSIPRNYGYAQLNFTAYDLDSSDFQTIDLDCDQMPGSQGYSTTPCSETTDDDMDSTEAPFEMCYTRSSISSTSTGTSRDSSMKATQDQFMDYVIKKLNAHSQTISAKETRSTTKDPHRGDVDLEDARLWMKILSSAQTVRDARAKRKSRRNVSDVDGR